MDSADLACLRATCLYQPGRHKPLPRSAQCWSAPVRNLLQNGYSFLPLQYSGNGYLFRGMRNGVCKAVAKHCFSHVPGEEELSRVERAMGIYFLTHEISDAVSASALHNAGEDNAILVINADYFNRQLRAYRAAVLAIGDAGFVFRYPFVSEPLGITDIDYIITTATGKAAAVIPEKIRDRLILLDRKSRQELEHCLQQKLIQAGITPAQPIASNCFPGQPASAGQ